MSLHLRPIEIDFIIDNDGILESHEITNEDFTMSDIETMLQGLGRKEKVMVGVSNFDDNDIQKMINGLIKNDKVLLGERTEGTIKISNGMNFNVYNKVFNSPNDCDYTEYHK